MSHEADQQTFCFLCSDLKYLKSRQGIEMAKKLEGTYPAKKLALSWPKSLCLQKICLSFSSLSLWFCSQHAISHITALTLLLSHSNIWTLSHFWSKVRLFTPQLIPPELIKCGTAGAMRAINAMLRFVVFNWAAVCSWHTRTQLEVSLEVDLVK